MGQTVLEEHRRVVIPCRCHLRENNLAAVLSCAWISMPTVNSQSCLDASSDSLRSLFCARMALASCFSCLRRGTRSVVGAALFWTARRLAWMAISRVRGRTGRLGRTRARTAPLDHDRSMVMFPGEGEGEGERAHACALHRAFSRGSLGAVVP